jgi:hypothetical protein
MRRSTETPTRLEFTVVITGLTSLLNQTFAAAVKAFNDHDNAALSPLLTGDATLITPGPPGGPSQTFSPKAAVLNYFSGTLFPKNPNFSPINAIPSLSNNGNGASINGYANWTDSDGDPDGVIRYDFQFRKVGGQWKISVFYGSRD